MPMRPIKVLHLTSAYRVGGIDTYIFSHYKYMNRDRFQFTFMTRNGGLQDAEQFQEFSYDVKLLPTTAAGDRELFIKRVREILMEGYDVLHLHTSYWTGFLIEEIAKEVGIPKIIVHSHNTSIADVSEPEERKILLKQHEAVKKEFSLDLATDFCACSWKAADWLFGPQIPREKIRIMKNAIEVERFQFNPKARKQIRAELGLENMLVLGSAGRLAYQKNPEFLIEVFGKIRKEHKNAKLLMIGDGELRKDVERQIQRIGLEDAVLLLGWKTNVEDYLQAMDCFLLPSRFEGNPISLIEATASGLPCVIADTITEEAVISNTIHRISLDISGWFSTLEEILNKPIDRLRGTETARAAGYDVKQQAKVLEGLYEGTII